MRMKAASGRGFVAVVVSLVVVGCRFFFGLFLVSRLGGQKGLVVLGLGWVVYYMVYPTCWGLYTYSRGIGGG